MPTPTRRAKGVDYDALTKDLVTTYFDLFIQLSCPDLHRAVDWNVPYHFLEQELHNRLKGRYKVKGKHHKTDKFARLRLLDGTDHYIYVHCEFQHRPEVGYGRRMFTYFILAFLGYADMEYFSSITFFTGAPPNTKDLTFKIDCFGTKWEYKFVAFVAANQDERALLASDNPFSLAVLAALYAQKTTRNVARRMAYKEKLISLAIKKGWTDERWEKLIIFVLDFVHLPEAKEQEFANTVLKNTAPSPINDETMPEQQPSFAVRNFFETAYKKMYGFDPQEALKAKREAEQREAAAKREAEQREAVARREAEQREAAVRREAEQRERERIIFAFSQTSKMPAGEIATVLNVTVEYVESVIQRALAEQAATAETPGNAAPGKGKTPRRPAASKRGKNT